MKRQRAAEVPTHLPRGVTGDPVAKPTPRVASKIREACRCAIESRKKSIQFRADDCAIYEVPITLDPALFPGAIFIRYHRRTGLRCTFNYADE